MYFTPQHEFETCSQSKCFLLLFFIILRLRHNFSLQPKGGGCWMFAPWRGGKKVSFPQLTLKIKIGRKKKIQNRGLFLPHHVSYSWRRRDDGGGGVMAKPDRLVAFQTLSSERVQQVHLSLSDMIKKLHVYENWQLSRYFRYCYSETKTLCVYSFLSCFLYRLLDHIFYQRSFKNSALSKDLRIVHEEMLHKLTWLRIPKKLYGLFGPGVRVASTQTKE